jgi:hypothetical protein
MSYRPRIWGATFLTHFSLHEIRSAKASHILFHKYFKHDILYITSDYGILVYIRNSYISLESSLISHNSVISYLNTATIHREVKPVPRIILIHSAHPYMYLELMKSFHPFYSFRPLFLAVARKPYEGPSPENCCWASPAQSFLVSGPVGTHDQIYVRSKNVYVFPL